MLRINKRQLNFLRRIMGKEGLEKLTLTGDIECKKERGKQRITYISRLCR